VVEIDKYDLCFLLLLLGSIALRFYYFIGLDFSDDQAYVQIANEILNGNFRPSKWILSQRLGIVFPMAFFYGIFGINEFSASFYALLSFVVLLSFIYYFSSRYFGKREAILACLLFSIFPLSIEFSTTPMGDIPLGLFATLSLFAFILAIKRERPLYYLLTGLFVGVSYLIKLLGLVLLLPPLIYMLLQLPRRMKKSLKAMLIFLLGFSLSIVLEVVYYGTSVGDPLLRLSAVSYYSEPARIATEFNTDLWFYPKLFFPHILGGSASYFSLFFYFFFPASLFLLFTKKIEEKYLAFWSLVVLLYLQFGTMSIGSYIPIHRLPRHLLLVLPSCATVAAVFFMKIAKKYRTFYPFLLLFLILLLADFVPSWQEIYEYHQCSKEDLRISYEILKEKSPRVIVADYGEIAHLSFYFGFPKNLTFVPILAASCNGLRDAYVMINGTRYWYDVLYRSEKLATCFKEPPSEWKLVARIKGSCGGMFGNYDAAIYYIA